MKKLAVPEVQVKRRLLSGDRVAFYSHSYQSEVTFVSNATVLEVDPRKRLVLIKADAETHLGRKLWTNLSSVGKEHLPEETQ